MINHVKTAVLLGGLAGLMMGVGFFFGPTGLTIAFLISLVTIGGSYFFSDKLAIRAAKAIPLDDSQLPKYRAIMEELTQRAGMPMPALYISPEQQPNAFATGRNPKNAAVCVTEGLLRNLSWSEIRGVLAHELAHIKNRDILTSSVAAMIATVISYAANMAMWTAMRSPSQSNRRDNGNPFIILGFSLLAPLAAGLIKMAISRSREYAADRSAARLIDDGEPLARALEKLHGFSQQITSSVPPPQASHYIINPLTNRKLKFSEKFATHPKAEERIRRLRSGEWRS